MRYSTIVPFPAPRVPVIPTIIISLWLKINFMQYTYFSHKMKYIFRFEKTFAVIYTQPSTLFIYAVAMREQIHKYYADKKIFWRIIILLLIVLIVIFQLTGKKI